MSTTSGLPRIDRTARIALLSPGSTVVGRLDAYTAPVQCDYVVVGTGSAGSVVANRLSADPGVRVVVLEAGPMDSDKFVHIPAAFSKRNWSGSLRRVIGVRVMHCGTMVSCRSRRMRNSPNW